MPGEYKVRFAFQTITWGARPGDFADILSGIKRAGFEGLEIAQAPAFLPAPERMRELLQYYDVHLLALCGGSLPERVNYCRAGHLEPDYYYVERIDDATADYARREKITLALHPHVYNENLREDVLGECLARYPEALFIPDTAHLHLAHIDSRALICQHYDRLASVHLKDWVGIYGRSFQQYARGFALPGQGEVHPEAALNCLKDRHFEGWVVVECDHARTTADEYALLSRDWLAENGAPPNGSGAVPERGGAPDGRPEWLKAHRDTPEEAARRAGDDAELYREMFSHLRTDSLEEFGERILETLCRRLPDVLAAQIWEYSPADQLLGLLAEQPRRLIAKADYVLDATKNPLGDSAESKSVTRIGQADAAKGFGPAWFRKFMPVEGCEEILALPILNSFNINQVQLLVTFCCAKPLHACLETMLLRCSDAVALAYEIALDDLCRTRALQIQQKLGGEWLYEGFLDAARTEIMQMVGCEGASIFLADEAGKRLLCVSTSGIKWRQDLPIEDRYYTPDDDSMTGRVWQNNEAVLIYAQSGGGEPKSEEVVTKKDLKLCLIVPIRDQRGTDVGVLRLRNRSTGRRMFSLSDMAIAEALCQAIIPTLLTLQQTDRFRKTIDRTIHEIKMPLTAINGAVEVMESETNKRQITFKYDYIGDIKSWLRLQESQIRRIDFYRYRMSGREEKLNLAIAPVWLLRDVLAPAKRHVETLLRERGYDRHKITDDQLYHIPQLYVDKAMFQQIFFNLLGNAIKYCYWDPDSFQVHIWSKREGNNLLIIFDDYGRGIPEGYEKAVFEPYVRGPGASRFNVSGDGLGLWIVRDLVAAHGGTVAVTRRTQPTQFTITLPNKLMLPNWHAEKN